MKYAAYDDTTKATTRDLGLAIRDQLEGKGFWHFVEDTYGDLREYDQTMIEFVDVGNPDNLVVHCENGQRFRVRIFAE